MPRAANLTAAVTFYTLDLERERLRVLAAENGTTPNQFAKRIVLEAVYRRFPELKPQDTKEEQK